MIADLDATIRQLLIDELPVKNGEIDISFEQPRREWSATISRPTVNLFLYDVRENNVLRQHQWERLVAERPNGSPSAGASSSDLAQLKRTPMRADCSYALTTWAADPEDEHRLLTRCIVALFRFPVLPARRLIGSLQSPPYAIQARVGLHDRLTEPSDLWNVLDNEMRPTVPYVITLALDPWQEMTVPIIKTRTLRVGQAQDIPLPLAAGGPIEHPSLKPDESRVDLNIIGGVVRSATHGAPLIGIEVAIKGTGHLTATDEDGRFVLGSLAPGEYTLVAWPSEGRPAQRTIRIPTEEGDYDIEL